MKQSGSLSRGFTLIEILIVVGIIAALAVMAGMSYSSVLQRSRDGKRKSDIEQIRSALELYRSDKGYYPATGAGSITDASGMAADLASYVSNIPIDPGGVLYKYKALDSNGSGIYYGYCLGATLESTTAVDNLCGASDIDTANGYNYGRKNP